MTIDKIKDLPQLPQELPPVAIPAKDADGNADVAQFARDWFEAVARHNFPEFDGHPFTVGNWCTRTFGVFRPLQNRVGSWIGDLKRVTQAWEALNSYLQGQSAGYLMHEALERTGLKARLERQTIPYPIEPFSFDYFTVQDLIDGGLSEPVDSNLTIAKIREMEKNGELKISDTMAALFATFDEKYTLQGMVSELKRIYPVNQESSHWLAVTGLIGENREAGVALVEAAIAGMQSVYLLSVRRADARLAAALAYRELALRQHQPNGGKIIVHAGPVYLSETNRWEPGRLVATLSDLLPVGATAVFAALSDGAGDDGSGLLDVLTEHAVVRSLIEKKKVTETFRYPSDGGTASSLSHGLAQLAKRWASEVEREKGGKILTEKEVMIAVSQQANPSRPVVIVQVRGGGKKKDEGIIDKFVRLVWPESRTENGKKNGNDDSGSNDRGSAYGESVIGDRLSEIEGSLAIAVSPISDDNRTPTTDNRIPLFQIVGAGQGVATSSVGFRIVGASTSDEASEDETMMQTLTQDTDRSLSATPLFGLVQTNGMTRSILTTGILKVVR